jgi:hypothetical protein
MKAECSDEILAHDLSTISTGLHPPSETSTRKGMDATRDHETIMDEDLYELHIWCHHDISSRPKPGKTHVTLFQEKIRSPEDVHPSLLDRKNQPSQLGLSTGTDPGKLPSLTTACKKQSSIRK